MTSPETTPAVEEPASGAVTTFDTFARFAATAPSAPPQPGQAPRSAEERLAYHSQFVTRHRLPSAPHRPSSAQ